MSGCSLFNNDWIVPKFSLYINKETENERDDCSSPSIDWRGSISHVTTAVQKYIAEQDTDSHSNLRVSSNLI